MGLIWQIRQAQPDDSDAIDRLVASSFATDDEAKLVGKLRATEDMLVELVADASGEIIGHVALSGMTVSVDDRHIAAAALAPVSVAERYRGKGIGATLCRDALRRWTKNGSGLALVLGDPAYYARFGFSSKAAASHLETPFPKAGDAFMLYDPSGLLKGVTGAKAHYPAPFGL